MGPSLNNSRTTGCGDCGNIHVKFYLVVLCLFRQNTTLAAEKEHATLVQCEYHICPNRGAVCECKGLGACLLISTIKPVVWYQQNAYIW